MRCGKLGLSKALVSSSVQSSASPAKLSFLIKGDLLLLLYFFLLLLHVQHQRSRIIHPPFSLEISSIALSRTFSLFILPSTKPSLFISLAFHLLFTPNPYSCHALHWLSGSRALRFFSSSRSINLPLNTSSSFCFLFHLSSCLSCLTVTLLESTQVLWILTYVRWTC